MLFKHLLYVTYKRKRYLLKECYTKITTFNRSRVYNIHGDRNKKAISFF